MDNVLVIESGKLRDLIEFYTSTATKDDGGGYPASTKTLAFSMLCEVVPKGSVRSYEGNKTEFTEGWQVRLRYEEGRIPNESMIAKFNNEEFVIKGIENVLNRNRVLKMILTKK